MGPEFVTVKLPALHCSPLVDVLIVLVWGRRRLRHDSQDRRESERQGTLFGMMIACPFMLEIPCSCFFFSRLQLLGPMGLWSRGVSCGASPGLILLIKRHSLGVTAGKVLQAMY